MRKKSKLVHGVGVNDSDYSVRPTINGKQALCQFYRTWSSMLRRCHCSKFQAKHPTYAECSVAPQWLVFSNFKAWMETQDWQGKDLDKDLLTEGNNVYSPDTCAFVDKSTNLFTIDCGATRGEWPIGVSFNKRAGKFISMCSNPFTRKLEYLGLFTCPNEAHRAWKRRKHEPACQLADLQSDPRVASALRTRYL